MDAAKFLNFIHSSCLYFSRGDQFQDKFEGAFTESLKHAIEQSYEENDLDFTYADFKRRLRERVFLNCWHKGPDDSMAMWNIYGRSTASIAITSTVGKVRKALAYKSIPYYVSIAMVDYVKHWRDPKLKITPYSNVFAYKVKAYEFEKEVRLIIDRFHEDFALPIDETGLLIELPVNDLLRSIVLGPEAPDWFVEAIQGVTAKYDVTAPVRRSKLTQEPV